MTEKPCAGYNRQFVDSLSLPLNLRPDPLKGLQSSLQIPAFKQDAADLKLK